MNELALFAGAGGGILGGHLLGWRTVCAVEIDAYCASVLCARQNEGILPPFPIWDDVRTFDGRPWRGIIDVVSGGFPCQDISCAGKGAGIDGQRSGLWKEMARVIGEVRPRYAFVENSPMLTIRGLQSILGDLAELGYDARWCVLGASDVGAPHIRKRIWILAHSKSERLEGWNYGIAGIKESDGRLFFAGSSQCGNEGDVAYAHGERRQQVSGGAPCDESQDERRTTEENNEPAGDGQGSRAKDVASNNDKRVSVGVSRGGQEAYTVSGTVGENTNSDTDSKSMVWLTESRKECNWWSTEPDVGRVVNGMAARVDRLKALGNGQVPRVAQVAWEILNE